MIYASGITGLRRGAKGLGFARVGLNQLFLFPHPSAGPTNPLVKHEFYGARFNQPKLRDSGVDSPPFATPRERRGISRGTVGREPSCGYCGSCT